MLSTLSRMFQAGHNNESDHGHNDHTESVRPLSKGKQHADALGLGLDIPVLERKVSSVSVAGKERPRPPRPSHVSWKSPSSQASPASLHQSASSPSLLFAPTSARPVSDGYRPSSLRRTSSHSSHLTSPEPPAALDNEGSNRGSAGPADLPPTKPLSPIDERVYFPPQRRPSLDSLPPTPDSTRVYDGHSEGAARAFLHAEQASPSTTTVAYPTAFISRPLNRTISQTSTSTLRSTASAAPSIPPLDLRPNFHSALGVAVPRKSRLAPPSLPTVLGSPPRPAKYSVIYEDGASARTASFITAPSVHTPEPGDVDVDADDGAESDYVPSTGDTDTGMLPAGLDARSPQRASLHTFSSGPSRTDAETTDAEAYIHQRWLKGVSFGSAHLVLPPAPRPHRATSACVLFWLGFVGPWCWLIGGWLLSRGGEIKPEGEDMALPVWIRRKSRGYGGGGKEECHPAALKEKKHGLRMWFPLIAPSGETLSPVRSRTSVDSLQKQKRGQGVDPWVFRCRVAAIASGIIILAAFVVAVVIAGVRS
ncbi:hypothetical protein B0H21DRAFT_852136 [Amylocystis lapponica]|nr:hypothetical protein B0H21DRAFT_852136 [Amylocystis lapponica]